jgi:hypothetical protein
MKALLFARNFIRTLISVRVRALLAMAMVASLSACATVPTISALPVGPKLRLVEVDGRPAGERAFQLQFTSDSYAASYDCGDYVGHLYARFRTSRGR